MDREKIATIYDEIYKTGALIVKPAVDSEIERCQDDLTGIDAPKLPDDYIEYLKISNGMAWNGFEFFGTYQVTVKESGYRLIDIVSFNIKQREYKYGLQNMLVLGRFDDDIYVYNNETDCYQALDALTLIEIETYDSFEDLFTDCVGAYAFD